MSQRSSKELVEILKENNPYRYRTALRLLHEREAREVGPLLRDQFTSSKDDVHTLRCLWGLWAVGVFDGNIVQAGLNHKIPHVRSWMVRLLGETAPIPFLDQLTDLAKTEPSPIVRLQMASSAQRFTTQDTVPLLHNLMKHKEDRKDPAIPLMIWLAYEPRVTSSKKSSLDWLKEHAPGNELASEEIVPRVIRRLLATGKAEDLQACVDFLGDVEDALIRRRTLEAFLQAFKNRVVEPPASWTQVAAKLRKDSHQDIQDLSRRLAVHFHDVEALARALVVLQDAKRSAVERIEAIRAVALTHPPKAQAALVAVLLSDDPIDVRVEACHALAGYDEPALAGKLLGRWKALPAPVRSQLANVLAGRKSWAGELLTALGKGTVPRTDLHDNTILRIRAFKDKNLNDLIEQNWGRFRDTPKELAELINKMRVQLHQGSGSFARGKLVFENQCAKCHKFEGKGHDVGPNLDGAARDIEYLLINVIDPNRVVGQPYYMRSVELKNGRIETGLLFAEDDMSITLKGENDVLKVISKKDIEGKVIVHEKSVMPEGLANNMTPQDFRDLVRYLMAHPFVTDVAVAGPLSWNASSGDEPVMTAEAKWTRPVVGPPGRIVLGAGKRASQVSVATAEVTAPTAMTARLLLGSGQTIRVWLNGKLVYKGQPGSDGASPDQTAVDVALRQGVNYLVMQLTHDGGESALYARFLDPERRLRYAEK